MRESRINDVIDIRDKIERLNLNLAQKKDLAKWEAPNTSDMSIAQMRDQIDEKIGKEKRFSVFTFEPLISVARSDLRVALDQKRKAKQVFEYA
jgi:hypothetical protein